MTITVNKLQRATLTFDRSSTMLDLIQALTENLGGEWDDATMVPRSISTVDLTGKWSIDFVLSGGDEEEPARPERWATEDGEHVAVVAASGYRTCCCEFTGTDAEVATHLAVMAADAHG